jgi:ankyrin repeat protein
MNRHTLDLALLITRQTKRIYMTASVTIHLYQPDQSLYKATSETENLSELLTKWFGESWVDNENEDAIFNVYTLQADEDGIIFTFEVSWLEDEKALFTAVRDLPAELTFTSVFYDQVGEYSRKWSSSGKNIKKQAFEETISQIPSNALIYSLIEDKIKLFKAVLPQNWGCILIDGVSMLEYCWNMQLKPFTNYLLKHLDVNCGLDYSHPTLLASAIKHGSAKLITQFIQYGANPLFVDAEGNNALHLWAEFNSDEALLLSLIQHGVPVNAQNTYGLTPVLCLLNNSWIEDDSLINTINILQRAGANLTVTCPKGGSLLWYANNNEIREYLRANGVILSRPHDVYVDNDTSKYGNPLNCAIWHDDEEMFIHYLQPKYINDIAGLLESAYSCKRLDWFKLILELCASQNQSFARPSFLLHILMENKEYELVRLLLAHGGDINGQQSDLESYLNVLWAINNGEDEFIQIYREAGCDPSAMLVCLSYSSMPAENAEVLCEQLLSDGADVNRFFEQDKRILFQETMGFITPLYAALRRKNVTMIRLLLEHGANPTFQARWVTRPMEFIDNLIRFEPGKDENKIIRDLLLAHGA